MIFELKMVVERLIGEICGVFIVIIIVNIGIIGKNTVKLGVFYEKKL
jgi:hypothetical protein